MRLHELAKVIIDVIVVSWSWQVEHCLSLINVVILTTTRTPGASLSARLSTLLDLNTARQFILARARSIDLLGLQVGLLAEGTVEPTTILLGSRWYSLFIKP